MQQQLAPQLVESFSFAAPALDVSERAAWIDEEPDDASPSTGSLLSQSVDVVEPSDDPVRMYLQEIHEVPLLTASDEKRLACRLEELVALNRVRSELGLDDRPSDRALPAIAIY